jgi:hypothetical protein
MKETARIEKMRRRLVRILERKEKRLFARLETRNSVLKRKESQDTRF